MSSRLWISINARAAAPVQYRRRSLLTGALVAAAIAALVVVWWHLRKRDGERHPRSVHLAMAPASVVLHSVATIADGHSPLVPGPGQSLYVRTLGASITNGFAPTRGSYSTEGQEASWTYTSSTPADLDEAPQDRM